jgi:hypothetical protein
LSHQKRGAERCYLSEVLQCSQTQKEVKKKAHRFIVTMAARQGISGQFAQYGDDAKRTFISSAPPSMFGYRWFSNMNTTCTIKSAPPRTPDVMSLLANKHGWLVKRNEQGVWQRRYCCVVPHTFLYYFDTGPGDHNMGDGPEPSFERLQETDTASNSAGFAVPVGIIDMECYTSVNRLSEGEDIMELTGDSITNPDLRSFFFKGESKENCEEWTTAFISDRHQALRDEREALKEVTDTFPLQLANMSNMIKEAEAKAEEKEMESYRIRSSAEEGRQQILELVREGIEGVTNVTATTDLGQNTNNNNRTDRFAFYNSSSPLSTGGSSLSAPNTPNSGRNRLADGSGSEASKANLRQHQSEALAQLDMLQRDQSKRLKWMGGASESVSILVELLRTISGEHLETSLEKEDMERQLNLKSHHSKSDYNNLEQRLKDQERYFAQQENSMKNRSNELEAAIKKLKKENSDLSSMLQNSQMELKIHSKKTKSKLVTLQEHKKILKKEVIDLRATLEEVKSESDVTSHQKAQLEVKLKKEKTRRLGLQENYKVLRDQLTVQERVWGMMQSSIAGGSVVMNGHGSVMGDQSVHMDDSVVDGGGVTSKKVSILPCPRDSTQNTRGALNIGVSSVGFHPRDVVVKRKVKGDNDDGSKGSRGSWSGKSLADDADNDDSNNSSLGDGQSEEKQKIGGEKSGPAHPPRHPNSNLRPRKHESRMSRSDMSVMSEITTDREIATTAYDDVLHHHLGQDSTDRSKPTNTIVIDSAIVLHDGNFDVYADSGPLAAQAGLTKVTSAPTIKTKKRHPLFLQTIPSLGDDSQATNAAQALSSTSDNDDIRENPDAPTSNEDFGLCGAGDEFTGGRGSHSSPVAALASFAACGRLSPTDGESPPTSNVVLGAAAEENNERPQRKSQPQSLLPPMPPATKNEIKDHHRHLERPPTGAPNKPKTCGRTALPKKPTLEDLLNDNDDMSFSSAMSEMRKIDSTSFGGSVISAENTAFSVSNIHCNDDDNTSVVSTGSNASRLSVAE